MLPAKPFYMIRHGQTQANVDRFFSTYDSLLTDKGRGQARLVHNVVESLETKPTVIVHSNIPRTLETAEIINEVLNIPMYGESDVRERNTGDWQGKPYDECGPDARTSHVSPPNGEDYHALFARVRQGMNNILESYNAPALIVTHGNVFRAFGGMYGLMVRETPGNCCIYEFQPAPEKSPFPWDVYSYAYDEMQGSVKRLKEDLYENCEIAKER